MKKISAVYKITNTITGDFYIGSSKDVKQRLAAHKCQSTWNYHPNNPMYLDMKKFGVDKFVFEIIEEVEVDSLKKTEQQFIATLKPAYNSNRANGLDIEKLKESQKKYNKSEKGKECQKKYQKSEKFKESQKKYRQSDKGKECNRKYQKKHDSQLCCYNGETLTLNALRKRFERKGIPHPTVEAKKYLLER